MGNEILLEKLDAFIRKYYKNRLIRGLIWFVAGATSLFFLTSFLEYIGNFSSSVRTVLFWVFMLFSVSVLIRFVVIPLLKLYHMGDRINHEQAAIIVGTHFPDIQDKLLNTLQLGKELAYHQSELLKAAITQKTSELKPVPFQQAIDFKSNLKYVKYAVFPLALLVLVILVAPGFSDSSKRIVNYNEEFVPKAPFDFVLESEELVGVQNEDFNLKLKTTGDVIPSEVYVDLDGYQFKMKSNGSGSFSHVIKRLSDDVKLRFQAEGFSSEDYLLKVLAKPTLLDYTAYIDYPNYTGLEDEELQNSTDLQVPVGTKIKWDFKARNTRFMNAVSADKLKKLLRKDDRFSLELPFLSNSVVKVSGGNDEVLRGDSLQFNVQVIPDDFPQIEMEERNDSTSSKIKYLLGEINDDYGFSQMLFKYRFIKSNDATKTAKGEQSQSIKINRSATVQSFYHYWDMSELNIEASDKIEYYFEVWDNDGVNGAKSARTVALLFEAPSLDKLNELTEKTNDQIKADLSESKKSIKEMNRDLLDLERKMTEKKELTWDEKKKINELLKQHQMMQQQMKQVVEQNKMNNTRESEFKKMDEEMLEKQKELEDLFEKVMDEEMKKLMDEIEKLMEQNKKDELMEKLEELEFSDKEMNKQMDRMLEQLKQLQLEKKVDETVQKLEKLAEKQKELSEETKDKAKDKEDLLKKQEELNKEFEKTKDDLKDINKKNKDLEKPLNLDTKKQEESQKKVEEDQKESSQQIQKNKRSNASQKQQDAAEEMKKMAKELDQMMDDAQEQQQGEDYNTLREILENLVQVSKDQEDLMQEFKTMRNYNPRYVELGQDQKKIKDDARMIEDSLLSLSKRVKQVEHFVNKEIGLVNSHMSKTLSELGERRTQGVVTHQQYVMTSLNNLALMLGQSLEQMQNQMKSQKPGSGSCNKPGGKNQKPGSGKMKSMREMQESLKKQLEGMSKEMKSGGQKPGSKEFAEAAAMQAAIRKRMKDLKRQLDKEGKGSSLGDMGKTEKMMDDLENDLYNKRLNGQVLQRQQEILTRLLEHEKAERQQEKDNQRKSNEGSDIERELPPSIEEYLKQKEKEQELLRSLPPDLHPYYKKKVREYFNSMEK